MGRLESGQDQFFYNFCLDDVVPADHLVRRIDAVLDLSWLRSELAPHYSHTGRPSIDPELMMRMLPMGRARRSRLFWIATSIHTSRSGTRARVPTASSRGTVKSRARRSAIS